MEKDIQETLSAFKPENFVFVISQVNHKPSGMVAAWHTRCSMNPPLYLVSLSKEKNTHKIIQASKEFVLAVPNNELEKEVLYFGSESGKDKDKFQDTGLETTPATIVKVPLIKKATFNFECKLIHEIDAGDHIIFIGEVVAAHHQEDKGILLNYGKKDGKRYFKEFPITINQTDKIN